jgi:hypothetical protein
LSKQQSQYDWIPDHQLHVIATLARADAIIEEIGKILRDFSRIGPLDLTHTVDGALRHLIVAGVKPMPEAVPRLVGDALNELRSALEHVVYAEVEYQEGRRLTAIEARSIEMPISDSEAMFTLWRKSRNRKLLHAFGDDSEFLSRMEELQPFRSEAEALIDPLTVLAAHTNHAKHRSPAVASTHLGKVNAADFIDKPGLVIPAPIPGPLQGGEVLATTPALAPVEVDVWATFAVQRPHTHTWHIVMYELAFIETWVRETAVPKLLAGSLNVAPIPPGLDITIGHGDMRAALLEADPVPAFERNSIALQAEGFARPGLIELLMKRGWVKDRDVIEWWVASLDDRAAINRFERLAMAATDPYSTSQALQQLRRIAQRAYAARDQ